MAKSASVLTERNITEDDNGAVLIDFTKQVPGKEGKQLGKAVLRYGLPPTGCTTRPSTVLTPPLASVTAPPCT